jgi:protein-tyrosine phosphatase
MAEGILRERLAQRGVDARVSSSGLSLVDRPATDHAAEVVARMGIDLSTHRSRVIDASQLEAADLVLGMERRHVREAYLLSPSVLPRSFTLPEFVRRAGVAGPCRGELSPWLARLSQGRRPVDLVGEASSDEVADPFGASLAVYERTAEELDVLCTAAADLLAGREVSVPVAVGAGSMPGVSEPGGSEVPRPPRASAWARWWRR